MDATRLTVFGNSELAIVLGSKAAAGGASVLFYHPDPEQVSRFTESDPILSAYPDFRLPDNVEATVDLERACRYADCLILALPGFEIRDTIELAGDFLGGHQCVVHTARGLDFRDERLIRISEIIDESCSVKKIGALTGPTLPGEWLAGDPGSMVIASPFEEVTDGARRMFSSPSFQIFFNPDMAGVELGAALTESFSITLGIVRALGFGAGATALVATRAITEMGRLGAAIGAKRATFAGLSGLGGLFVAGSREKSPGFMMGRELVEGSILPKDKLEFEGVHTLKSAAPFGKSLKLRLPILYTTHEIVTGAINPGDAIRRLASIEVGNEIDQALEETLLMLPTAVNAPIGGKGKGW